jgi:hypothetical protein
MIRVKMEHLPWISATLFAIGAVCFGAIGLYGLCGFDIFLGLYCIAEGIGESEE